MVAGFTVQSGFPEDQRSIAASLFWSAFRGKLEKIMGPEPKALGFLENVLDPAYALSAVATDGTLLGLAGYKTEEGSFAGGSLGDLCTVYGRFGGVWRGLLLNILERDTEPGLLLMDGIFVSERARGRGIGSALLKAIIQKAADEGLKRVRLDVIDTNDRARALYERMGFEAVSKEETGPFKHVFGFAAATRMETIIPHNN
ncbi:ribosomal protein S18 acetylase RimI-like enzyme [Labrenzia sp. EL_126]|nr:ribosomal protein S18 acetylase RimI-like enzyme [Labrenzia sp. EL_126]